MTHRTYLISDTHFGHANCLNFKRNDGSPLRPFKTVEEMDETMVDNWNKTVMDRDKIYHLGDCIIKKQQPNILSRLNGRKILVRGNHDTYKLKYYSDFFEDVRGYKIFGEYGRGKSPICSHIPIHPESLSRWVANIHGHLHANHVMIDKHKRDTRYINVSVEQINYTPIDLEEIYERIKDECL